MLSVVINEFCMEIMQIKGFKIFYVFIDYSKSVESFSKIFIWDVL